MWRIKINRTSRTETLHFRTWEIMEQGTAPCQLIKQALTSTSTTQSIKQLAVEMASHSSILKTWRTLLFMGTSMASLAILPNHWQLDQSIITRQTTLQWITSCLAILPLLFITKWLLIITNSKLSTATTSISQQLTKVWTSMIRAPSLKTSTHPRTWAPTFISASKISSKLKEL